MTSWFEQNVSAAKKRLVLRQDSSRLLRLTNDDPVTGGISFSDSPRYGSWMQTVNGRMFWPCDPRIGDFDLGEIAVALGNICRFGGHLNTHYSVAQHCVLVAELCPENLQLEGLMHDATEAYYGDIPRPLKYSAYMAGYREIEKIAEMALARQFDLHYWSDTGWPEIVKHYDNAILMAEHRDLQVLEPAPWGVDVPADPKTISPWPAAQAAEAWLKAYETYASAR